MKKLGVIIPTHNRKDLLLKLISQIKMQESGLKDLDVIPIIVVDGSTDGTIEALKAIEGVEFVRGDGSWWYTRSMNEGFSRAYELNVDAVLTLNDDIILDENYLAEIDLIINGSENFDVMGSITLTMDEQPKVFFSGIKRFIKWRLKEVKYLPKFKEVVPDDLTGQYPSFILPGRGMLISVDALKAIDGFDSVFPQYHSDGDFCLRAIKKGFDVKVSYNLKIYSYIGLTAQASSFKKSSFNNFLKGFVNPYSRNYLPQVARFVFRHGVKILWPFTFCWTVLGYFKAYFLNKKVV